MAKPTFLAGLPTDYYPVTPNDSTDNLGDGPTLGFYVVGAGDLVVTTLVGDRTIPVSDNQVLPLASATRIKSTGTTATQIFALKA